MGSFFDDLAKPPKERPLIVHYVFLTFFSLSLAWSISRWLRHFPGANHHDNVSLFMAVGWLLFYVAFGLRWSTRTTVILRNVAFIWVSSALAYAWWTAWSGTG